MADISKAKYFYDQGLRFLRCTERCMGVENDDGSIEIIGGEYRTLSSPTMVNSALSCELFLKAILIAHGIEYGHTHELKDFFEMLPKREYKNFLIFEPSDGTSFYNNLIKHSNDYVEWRYYMEKPAEYHMDPSFTDILMHNLGTLAKRVISIREFEQLEQLEGMV